MSRIVLWNPDTDEDDELWVCQTCDAHLHVDCVGNECPACGAPADDDERPNGESGDV